MENLRIVIENPRGTYKSFVNEENANDPNITSYPLKGVTYPVDYGYIEGYLGEDEVELDVFVGTGNLYGYIKIWRLDIPEETKFFKGLTEGELEEVKAAFKQVLLSTAILSEKDFLNMLRIFKIIE